MKYIFVFLAGFVIPVFVGILAYSFKPVQVKEVTVYQKVKEDCTKSEIYETALNQAVEYIRSLPQEEVRYLICN